MMTEVNGMTARFLQIPQKSLSKPFYIEGLVDPTIFLIDHRCLKRYKRRFNRPDRLRAFLLSP